jgi:hypothetical protein
MSATTVLEVGDTAPDFEPRGTHDGGQSTYSLSKFTDDGEWVFLIQIRAHTPAFA